MKMFTDEIYEKIYSNPEVDKIPISYVSTMISVIEKVIEENKDVDEFQ